MNVKRIVKYYFLKFFRIKASPEDISLGFAIGFIPNWYPTFGFGPAISIVLAKLFRGNIISAFIGGLSGTFLWPALFYLNYKAGGILIHFFSEVLFTFNEETTRYSFFYHKSTMISIRFLLGAIFNTVFFGLIIYFVSYFLITKYRYIYTRLAKKIKKNK